MSKRTAAAAARHEAETNGEGFEVLVTFPDADGTVSPAVESAMRTIGANAALEAVNSFINDLTVVEIEVDGASVVGDFVAYQTDEGRQLAVFYKDQTKIVPIGEGPTGEAPGEVLRELVKATEAMSGADFVAPPSGS
ncbi:hypothetical protein [Aurantimonas sp. 22II-16-19i]|uniref:hypothetical protein n=1 Tax=Aurantimonas sp. 22II-16-19i TaxID=1317114 RepID=UPI0009F7A761|nr:hypothetical protein [Aurantimonas sp. 22II-16-19i]ORE90159.1 hypothetical protein ATO4_22092 [Aurantimonas sp. 22II-16-19i]